MELDKADDLGWAVDLIAGIRRDGLLQQSPSIGSWLRGAAVLTTRKEWYDKPGALPDDVIAAIRKRFNIGWWSISLRLYGYEAVNEAAAGDDQQAQFAKHTHAAVEDHALEAGACRWKSRRSRAFRSRSRCRTLRGTGAGAGTSAIRRCCPPTARPRWTSSSAPTTATRNSAWTTTARSPWASATSPTSTRCCSTRTIRR